MYETLPPPIFRIEEKKHKSLFMLIVDNYYFDMYGISYLRKSKYFKLFDIVQAKNNRLEEFASHHFCIYTNLSKQSEDLYLYEAMANACIPITHKDTPGIHFYVTGDIVVKNTLLNTYVLDTIDIKSFDEAIEYALKMKKNEYDELKETIREHVKNRVDTDSIMTLVEMQKSSIYF
ncbi:putative glycosyltransferase [Sulfolobus filamentous virus 1]|uniref:Putative glycosyltransferase n=1 Tax=Sulfolobus filamentous virus 1 TaxID=2304198 RepID=A0A346LU49_SUFV1|nr:putative glycosyltransferase [Sulfolobus filamentous virus 1]AXQ00092.1 putative glycosyltransferase [Sulfolobus filamentous virus 1]